MELDLTPIPSGFDNEKLEELYIRAIASALGVPIALFMSKEELQQEKELLEKRIKALMDIRDFHIRAGHVNPDNDQPVECKCGWRGTIIECNYVRAGEYDAPLAQRKGYQWLCPKCGEIVWTYWYLVS